MYPNHLQYANGGEYEIYADYSYAETTVVPDAEEDEDDDTEEETATDPTNIWLLASSIAIAAVLVFAVIFLISGGLLLDYYVKDGQAEESFENIAEIFRGFRKNKKARKKKNISNDHTPQ